MKNIHQLLKPSFTINPSFLTTIEEEQNEMQLSDSQIAILKHYVIKKVLLKDVQVLAKH